MNCNKMIEINKEISRQKIHIAEIEIKRILDNKEQITVASLAKNTGFSRSFFYRNSEMRKKVEDSARRQVATYNARNQVEYIALVEENQNLKMTVKILNLQIERLKRENAELKKNIKKGRCESCEI